MIGPFIIMARMVFSEVVGTLSFLRPEPDDNMVDRLHYYYTSTFLLVTAVLISLKMFGGRPIECWLPAEYKASWEDYTETYCWARSTYWAPFKDPIPETGEEREVNLISYYQWAPFGLILCAFCFYAPCLIWRLMYDRSGIRIRDIVQFANDRSNIQPAAREANIRGLAAHLGSVFKHRFRHGTKHPLHHKIFKYLNIRYYEAYLTYLYLFIKAMFFMNVVLQMFLMNKFLQTDDYDIYGFGVLKDLINRKPWQDSGNFARISYCDMDIRILGNVQRHTVQCVLVINIFTEKVFVLLWIWYTMLASVTFISLCLWASDLIPLERRKRYIARRLELADVEFNKKTVQKDLTEFTRDYIKMDGAFVLNMITIHCGLLMCTEIVDKMWEDFLSEKHPEGVKTPGVDSPGGPFMPPRRKTSVLVPLISRDDGLLTPQPGMDSPFLRPPSSAGGNK
uniref:Innexin n=1 Tax=Panagrellus redivivus TaxID=6233 RepID=A0A7E4UZ64_PANRE